MLKDHLTPGQYMKRCRERAGLTIAAAAKAIAIQSHDRLCASADLRALEGDRPGDYGRLVRHLKDRAVFSFDFSTFTRLTAATSAPELDEWADI